MPVRLWLAVADEDHPKACTGRRLLRQGLALPLGLERTPRHPPILLDPHASAPLSPADRPAAEAGGVLGVDCSWNRLRARGGYPRELAGLGRLRVRRRLPLLIAANAQHYGRLAELNTAEALAAALFVLGEPERARSVVRVFSGGDSFEALNGALLAAYAGCGSADQVAAAEAEFF